MKFDNLSFSIGLISVFLIIGLWPIALILIAYDIILFLKAKKTTDITYKSINDQLTEIEQDLWNAKKDEYKRNKY